MLVSKIGCRLSAVGASFSQEIGLLLRKITRLYRRQYVGVCRPGEKVSFQYNNHPSTETTKDSSRRAFTDSCAQSVIFHCYWYGKFDRKQAMSVKSLLATQKGYSNEVWLWLDKDTLSENGDSNPYISQLKGRVRIMEFTPELVKSIPAFRRVYFMFGGNENLAFRADGFRLWVLHEYGGCYFDLDVMFIRSMGDLFRGSEFIYSWERQRYANNALIFLRKGSYMSEYIVRKAARIFSTQPWNVFNYDDKGLKYMKLYECSLFDPLWDCAEGMYILPPGDFAGFMKANPAVLKGAVRNAEEMFPYSYCHHWHNCWNDEIEPHSPFEFCEKEFDGILGLASA